MSKPLVVVESPTKIRTIKKYLGNQYNIAATVGHIKDLPQKEIGIDIDAGFKPKYKNIPGKQKIISSLKKAAGNAKDIYLAPDPDIEGEAIAWHTAQILKKEGRTFHRVLFHELTLVLKCFLYPVYRILKLLLNQRVPVEGFAGEVFYQNFLHQATSGLYCFPSQHFLLQE